VSTLSVVVPTLGRPGELSLLLKCISLSDPKPNEVLIVDGDASETAADVVERWRRKHAFPVEHLVSRPGASHQRNVGIERASGDIVVFVDDDVIFGGPIFAQVERAFDDPSIVGVTGRVVEPRATRRRFVAHHSRFRRWIPGGGRQGTFTRFGYPRYIYELDDTWDVQFMPGCFMCARRAAAEAVLFDEQLELAEDEDFSFRLSQLGRIQHRPEIVVYHQKLGFTARDPRSFDARLAWARRYIFEKNFEQTRRARAQFALLRAALVGHRVVNGDFAGARGVLEVSRGNPQRGTESADGGHAADRDAA
jgi:glycosyltransferase involved in cell wall biosynthesis